jgi:branched-chain amino acid transport system substrate-binding protein
MPSWHSSMRRSRSALAMTDTELNVIAALAMIGFSRIRKTGYSIFVAAEPVTEAITWFKGHDHVFLGAPEHLRARAHAGREGGQDEAREVGDHRAQLRVRQARLGDVPRPAQGVEARRPGRGEHWPALGKLEAGPLVTAILNENPDALYVSLFGSDWLNFVRQAGESSIVVNPSPARDLLLHGRPPCRRR